MMDLLVVRHGIAVEREDAERFGLAEERRPLTAEGRTKMKRVARGLSRRAPNLTALFSSPLRRAVETAEVLEGVYPDLEHVETEALLPQTTVATLGEFLWKTGADGAAAIVGHEPQLSEFVGYCVGASRSAVELKKGGACLLRFETGVKASQGRLLWLLTPKLLRKL